MGRACSLRRSQLALHGEWPIGSQLGGQDAVGVVAGIPRCSDQVLAISPVESPGYTRRGLSDLGRDHVGG